MESCTFIILPLYEMTSTFFFLRSALLPLSFFSTVQQASATKKRRFFPRAGEPTTPPHCRCLFDGSEVPKQQKKKLNDTYKLASL